ncbi:hypothetical protein LTR86_009669 [Recurvomyces mirabilis]|nr:hypothetical protein LTR86_009669 [Recurvomyces mirabilis]
MAIKTPHGFIHQDNFTTQDPDAIAKHLEHLTKRLSEALTDPFNHSNITLLRSYLAKQLVIGASDQDDTHGLIPEASVISPEEYIAFAQARKMAFPGWRLEVVPNLSTAVSEDGRSATVWLLTRSTVDERLKREGGEGVGEEGRGGRQDGVGESGSGKWRENICKAYWKFRPLEGRWIWWKYEMMDGPAGWMCGDL